LLEPGGDASGEGGAGSAAGVNLAEPVAQATRQAIEGVKLMLAQLARQAGPAGEDGQARRLSYADVAGRLLVGVQLAHGLEALSVGGDDGLASVSGRFAPGFHGLAMTSGDGRIEHWLWPADALAANLSPRSQLVQLLTRCGYDVTALPRVAAPGGPPLWRFGVHHVVRPGPGQPITELVRGQIVLPPSPVTGRTVDDVARRLARHLRGRQRDDGSLLGTYHPTSDRYRPASAPVEDVALAMYAVARRAKWLDGRSPGAAGEAEQVWVRRTLEHVLGQLADRQAGAGDQGSGEDQRPMANGSDRPAGDDAHVAALALTVLTLVDGPGLGDRKAVRDRLAGQLIELALSPPATEGNAEVRDGSPGGPNAESEEAAAGDADVPDGAAAPEATGSSTWGRPTRALLSAALAAVHDQRRDRDSAEALARVREGLRAEVTPSHLASVLPWLAMADLRVPPGVEEDLAERRALVAAMWGPLVEVVRRLQVARPPRLGPADVVGGFDLVDRAEGDVPHPDWRSSHLLAFLSIALADPTLREDRNALTWLLDCGLGARFLAQLMVDESGCYYVRSPQRAAGGLRTALWDNRLGVAPAAMGLLAVTELQSTMGQFAQ
jgi:hypothetical protein